MIAYEPVPRANCFFYLLVQVDSTFHSRQRDYAYWWTDKNETSFGQALCFALCLSMLKYLKKDDFGHVTQSVQHDFALPDSQ